ncbi:MAG: sulfotransferase [Thermodesulfobacteriota bacterium]
MIATTNNKTMTPDGNRSEIRNGNRNRFAFMFSNWYSGATLLAILLNNHCRLTCNGETFPFKVTDLEIYRCSCGKDLMSCEFYRVAGVHMLDNPQFPENRNLFSILPRFSRFKPMDQWLNSLNYLPGLRDLIIRKNHGYRSRAAGFVNAHRAFFDRSCAFEGSDLYIDGTKSVRRAELFAQYQPEPFRIVYLLRDGRGFCRSFLKNRKLDNTHLALAANTWREYIQMVDRFILRNPDIPVLMIRYEDICRNPEMILSQVTDFLEVERDPAMLTDFSREYHILGNVMRKGFNGRVTEDLSWQTVFSGKEIDVMTAIMRSDLVRFGYME